MIANPTMKQEAPYPTVLAELVEQLEYRAGWQFRLAHIDRGQDSTGLTLMITTQGYDSYNPENGETYRVRHYMPVPPAAYNQQSWQRWLFDQCLLVERHECCEFFKINGKRPYAPHHGPGNDPYIVFERGTDEDARTMYTGEVRPTITPRDVLDRMKPRDQNDTEDSTKVRGGYTAEKGDKPEVPTTGSGVMSDQAKDSESDRLVPRYPSRQQETQQSARMDVVHAQRAAATNPPPRPHPSEPFRKG